MSLYRMPHTELRIDIMTKGETVTCRPFPEVSIGLRMDGIVTQQQIMKAVARTKGVLPRSDMYIRIGNTWSLLSDDNTNLLDGTTYDIRVVPQDGEFVIMHQNFMTCWHDLKLLRCRFFQFIDRYVDFPIGANICHRKKYC